MDGKPDMSASPREEARPARPPRKFDAKPAAGGERRTEDKPWKKKAPAGDRPAKFEGKKDKPFEKRAPKKK
jgi:ATP-dependent RNA helicase DeaD